MTKRKRRRQLARKAQRLHFDRPVEGSHEGSPLLLAPGSFPACLGIKMQRVRCPDVYRMFPVGLILALEQSASEILGVPMAS